MARLAGCQLAPETRQRIQLAACQMEVTGAQGDEANRNLSNGVSCMGPRNRVYRPTSVHGNYYPANKHDLAKPAFPISL
jgi:hypothetical protein